MEASLYQAACWPWDDNGLNAVRALRDRVETLGVHLPFMDLNPISANPGMRDMSLDMHHRALDFAAEAGADYAVLHARGVRCSPQGDRTGAPLWEEALRKLLQHANGRGLIFCLENADDLRPLADVRTLLDRIDGLHLCLDIGHLHERLYPLPFEQRFLLSLNDRFHPRPFRWKKRLPMNPYPDWPEACRDFGDRLACIHLHNHDGREAHRPLRQGKIDMTGLRHLRKMPSPVPIIIESDYRHLSEQAIGDDIGFALACAQ